MAAETEVAASVSGTRCIRFCSLQQQPVTEGEIASRPCSDCYATEIRDAILFCDACKRKYPVIDGIPRFNPDARDDYPEFFVEYAGKLSEGEVGDAKRDFRALHRSTKKSFGFQWLRYRVTDHQENREHLYRRLAVQPGALGGQLFFEAGCGMGRYLKVFTDEPGAEVVGLDLSLAVNRAYEENRGNPLIHVVQGNIMQLPLRHATFDHAYSIGVLHHTPSTRLAFRSMAKLVKPGGRISIWVYHVWLPPGLKGFAAMHARWKGRVTDTVRRITTHLPHRVLHYLCYLAIPGGWIQARIWAAPKPVKALLSPLLLVQMSIHEKPEIRLLDTFDWYSPQYQWKHTVNEVEGWFHEEGIENINSEGFPVSVRGRKKSEAGH